MKNKKNNSLQQLKMSLFVTKMRKNGLLMILSKYCVSDVKEYALVHLIDKSLFKCFLKLLGIMEQLSGIMKMFYDIYTL